MNVCEIKHQNTRVMLYS